MADKETNYAFEHRTYMVHTVAIYGSEAPVICRGPLIMRFYFDDSTKKNLNVNKTADSIMDTIFYETNKIIRLRHDNEFYGTRRILRIVPFPQLGNDYIFVYNSVEEPSEKEDDLITVLGGTDPNAHGLAVILKRSNDGGIEWLSAPEAEEIVRFLSGK
jgi:hypothetical protein